MVNTNVLRVCKSCVLYPRSTSLSYAYRTNFLFILKGYFSLPRWGSLIFNDKSFCLQLAYCSLPYNLPFPSTFVSIQLIFLEISICETCLNQGFLSTSKLISACSNLDFTVTFFLYINF